MPIIKNKKTIAYIALWFVILIWGIAPLFTKGFFEYYSPSASVLHTSVLGFVFFFLISLKKLKKLNSTYFKIAVSTGIFYSAADILQKIGLNYTTPTRYAFLENLSCVIVPILLFFLIKKKPSFLTVLASVICLAGAFLLSFDKGAEGGLGIGIGEILCALAGLCYGVNIAVTGVYAKKLDASLYLMIQMGVCSIISLSTVLLFNNITVDGSVIEAFRFTFKPDIFIAKCVITLLSSSIGWLLRTWSMKYISHTVVTVLMPLASVVTAISSVVIGSDTLTFGLIAGGTLGFIAAILSELGDSKKEK